VGDPGLPVMIGVLAVPIGVLLLVLVLALMGSLWASPVPLDEQESGEFGDLEEAFEPRPLPPYVPESASRAYGYRPVHTPPAQQSYGSGAPDPYGPSAPDPYGSPARDPYGSPAPQPFWPAARESYGSPAQSPYAAPRRETYGSSAQDPYAHPPGRDPEPEQPRGFPYGPYKHQ
jgi:hypothetical protein